MSGPPAWIVGVARDIAAESPCAKSKRGAVIYSVALEGRRQATGMPVPAPHSSLANTIIAAADHNSQPDGFTCDGSDQCRRRCRYTCLHAEQRAILSGINCRGEGYEGHDLVHVKVAGVYVVPSGGPSCWQCSRLVVDVGLRGVWLFEEGGRPGRPEWRYYLARRFHEVTLETCEREGFK